MRAMPTSGPTADAIVTDSMKYPMPSPWRDSGTCAEAMDVTVVEATP